jgi:twitching motility protein PilT
MINTMDIEKLLRFLVAKGGSDLHLKVGRPPLLRIKGDLIASDWPVISKEEMQGLLLSVLTEMQREKLGADKELDFSYLVEGLARFRGNIFHQSENGRLNSVKNERAWTAC